LALGAPIGSWLYFNNFLKYGWFGHLIPTNPVWAVTVIGRTFKFAFKTTVRGPGQNAFVNI